MRRDKTRGKLRVVVADDHRLVREAFCLLLSRTGRVEIVGEAGDGRETIALIQQHRPDLVLMDVAMPNLNGIDATTRIKSEFPRTKVLIISMHSDEEYVIRAFRAGASGYVLKDAAASELELAVKSIATGRTFLGPSISRNVVNKYLKGVGETQNSLDQLPGANAKSCN